MFDTDYLELQAVESIRQLYNDDGPTLSEKKAILQSVQSYLDECFADLAAAPIDIIGIPNHTLPPIVDLSGRVAS